MIVKLLAIDHLEFLSLKGGCRGLSESTLVKMSNCWKSHAAAQFFIIFLMYVLHLLLIFQCFKSNISQCTKCGCMMVQ